MEGQNLTLFSQGPFGCQWRMDCRGAGWGQREEAAMVTRENNTAAEARGVLWVVRSYLNCLFFVPLCYLVVV